LMSHKSVGGSVAGMFGLLAVAESLLFIIVASGEIGLWLGLLLHGFLIAAATDRLRRCHVGDKSLWTIGLLTTALVGPLGAICVTVLSISERHARPSSDLLAAWYSRICGDVAPDHAGQIYAAILTNRAIRPGSGGFRRFVETLQHGTLSEKQALLGLIGLNYHNDYYPLLGLALRSREACVRAQAAAVFVKLKEEFKSRLRSSVATHTAAEPRDSEDALARVHTILSCTESGFIEPAAARDAHAVAKSLCKWAIAAGAATGPAEALLGRVMAADGEHLEVAQFLQSRVATLDPDARVLLANSLVALGRHRELLDVLRSQKGNVMSPTGEIVAANLAA